MQYYKSGKICHRIVRYSDIIAIATLFEKLVQQNGGENIFSVLFCDGSAVTDSKQDIFSSDLLCRKDIKLFSFEYMDTCAERKLRIKIREERWYSSITNTYEISSVDEIWYNSVLTQVNELVKTFRKHHWLRRAFDFPAVLATYLLYWAILCGIMMGPLEFEYGERVETTALFIPTSAFYVVGTILFVCIVAAVYYVFPDMEFDLEMPRSIRRKKIRKSFIWVLGTIMIPIVLSLLVR